MSFADNCRHCEHFHVKVGKCCFCEKVNLPDVAPRKTMAEHLAEIEDTEIEI